MAPTTDGRRRFVVRPHEEGTRLDVLLAGRAGLSRSAAQRLIARGRVLVDGNPARKRHEVRAGEVVEYSPEPPAPVTLEAEDLDVRVVYEDDWLLVVDKPAGLVVHPAPGHSRGTLAHRLVTRGATGGAESRPGIVHRLDKDTSGLLIVARSGEAWRRLVAQLARREITRVFLALLSGALPEDEGTIDAPIGRHVRDRQRMSLHAARARPARTHFRVIARAPGFTLTRAQLETGRTHQIRVHFAALGHPVAGDAKYGRRPRPQGLGRQFLHAARLSFAHPDDGRHLSFASPLPPDLSAFAVSLGLPAQPPV